MTHEPDWRKAFGEPDARFMRTIEHTLAGLANAKEETRVKKLRIAVLIGLLSALLIATAWAAASRHGIFDFLNRYSSAPQVLPEASELVETHAPQDAIETVRATYRVRESIYDGTQVYLVVEVRPTDPQTLLTGTDAGPDDPYDCLVRTGSDTATTIAQHAQRSGMNMVHTSVTCQAGAGYDDPSAFPSLSIDFLLEDDGTLVYLLKGAAPKDAPEALPIDITCIDEAYVRADGTWTYDMATQQRTTLSITLRASQAHNDSATSAEPVTFADCGVRIDRVTLKGTPMAIYTEVAYTVIDEAAYAAQEDGLMFEFLGADGERLPDGPGGGGSGGVRNADGTTSTTVFLCEGTLQAMPTLPDRVTLRAFNCWTKERYEAHDIALR